MSGSRNGYSPRRAGEVTGVKVIPANTRPVKITLFDHNHQYEVAWTHTENGPVVTDLRITSENGTPITSNSVKRIPVERLAKAAALHDTREAAQQGRVLREAFKSVVDRYNDPDALVAEACNWLESTGDPAASDAARQLRDTAAGDAAALVADALESVEQFRFTEGVVRALARRQRAPASAKGGRPTEWTPEFLAQVAQWAREALPHGGSVYERVRSRASEELGYNVSIHQVKWWIKQCKQLQPPLLSCGDLRRPRKRRASAPDGDNTTATEDDR